MKENTSTITLNVALDAQKVPETIKWSASDNKIVD